MPPGSCISWSVTSFITLPFVIFWSPDTMASIVFPLFFGSSPEKKRPTVLSGSFFSGVSFFGRAFIVLRFTAAAVFTLSALRFCLNCSCKAITSGSSRYTAPERSRYTSSVKFSYSGRPSVFIMSSRVKSLCCCALSEVFTLPSSSRLSPFPVSASVTASTTSTKIPRDANRIIFVFVALSIALLLFRFLFYPDDLLYELVKEKSRHVLRKLRRGSHDLPFRPDKKP